MSEEKVRSLLEAVETTKFGNSKGSGIGVKNVHQRIQLYYGKNYGLEINSEMDVGTSVLIHLPHIEGDSITNEQWNGK
jgi:two-component system sensor histidine kinase YesM